MTAWHLSVFAENRPGRLETITGILARAGVNIRAIKISDLGEHGVVKILVNDPDAALRALTEAGVAASKLPVLVVAVEDRPGGLYEVLTVLTRHGINVEDAYGFARDRRAILVIEVPDVAAAAEPLRSAGLQPLSAGEAYNL
ncbi:MAG: ACT domain-containing protein [Desulfobacterales bacterium]